MDNVGTGSVIIKGLGNGTYYVHATYLGDDQYLTGENNTETFVIAKNVPGVSVVVDNVTYGNHSVMTNCVFRCNRPFGLRVVKAERKEMDIHRITTTQPSPHHLLCL